MGDKSKKAWLLDGWKVFPDLNLIQNHQSELVIKPRLMKLLTFFLLHQNQVVTKEVILDFVWEDRIVTENLLTKSISELRKILEEHFSTQLKIETIRNVGYRLNTFTNEIPYDATVATLSETEQSSTLKKWPLLIALFSAVLLLSLVVKKQLAPDSLSYKISTDRVTSLQGQEISPTISPDGKNIAFAYRKKPAEPFHIYLRALNGSTPRRLSASPAEEYNPCWSPDGAAIAFMRSDSQGIQLIKSSIVGADEQLLTNLVGYSIRRGLRWLAKENQLVFSARKVAHTAHNLYAYDLKQARLIQLTNAPAKSLGDIHPTIGPEAGQVAFIRVDASSTESGSKSGESRLQILDLKTNQLTTIATFDQEVKELAYHPPTDQYLCWLSNELTDNQLIAIDKAGEKRLLYEFKNGTPAKGFMGPNHIFYYELWSSNLNVHQYELKDKLSPLPTSTEYLNSTLLDWGVRFASQADRKVFLSYRSGHKEIWTGPASRAEKAAQLTHFEDKTIQSASISPDGKQVVFLTKEDEETAIYVMLSNGEGLIKISEPGFDYTQPEWLNNSNSIYFGSTQSGQWAIWQQEIATGKKELLIPDAHAVLGTSDSTDKFYYANISLDTVYSFDPIKEKPLPLFSATGIEAGNWAVTTNGIYYLSWIGRGCELRFYDFVSQEQYFIRSLTNIIPGLPSLAVSSSNDFLYLAQADEIGSDLIRLRIE